MYEQYIPAPAPSKTEFNLFNSEMTKVIIGNTSTDNVATGEYVSLKKSIISGLSDGIYKSKSNIASGTPFVSSNLEAVTGGAVNALNDGLDVLNSKIETIEDISTYITSSIADFEIVSAKKWGHIVDIKLEGTITGEYGGLCLFNASISPLVLGAINASITIDGYQVPTYAELQTTGIWVVNKGNPGKKTSVHAVYLIA